MSSTGRPLRIGEMSVEGGGKFGAHVGAGHTQGFASTSGLFRKDGQKLGTNSKTRPPTTRSWRAS